MAGETTETITGGGAHPTHQLLPLRHFLAKIKGTDEEVYSKLIAHEAGNSARTAEAWRAVIEGLKGKPAWQPGRRAV